MTPEVQAAQAAGLENPLSPRSVALRLLERASKTPWCQGGPTGATLWNRGSRAACFCPDAALQLACNRQQGGGEVPPGRRLAKYALAEAMLDLSTLADSALGQFGDPYAYTEAQRPALMLAGRIRDARERGGRFPSVPAAARFIICWNDAAGRTRAQVLAAYELAMERLREGLPRSAQE